MLTLITTPSAVTVSCKEWPSGLASGSGFVCNRYPFLNNYRNRKTLCSNLKIRLPVSVTQDRRTGRACWFEFETNRPSFYPTIVAA